MANNAFPPDGFKSRAVKAYSPDMEDTPSPATLPSHRNGNPNKLRGASLPVLPVNHENGNLTNPPAEETSTPHNAESAPRSPPKHRRGPMPDLIHFTPPGGDIDSNDSAHASGKADTLSKTSIMNYADALRKPVPPGEIEVTDVRTTQRLGNPITNNARPNQNSWSGQGSGGRNSWTKTGPKNRAPSSPFPKSAKNKAKESTKSVRKGNSSYSKSPHQNSPKTGQDIERLAEPKATEVEEVQAKSPEVHDAREDVVEVPIPQQVQHQQLPPPMHVSPVAQVPSHVQPSQLAETTPNRIPSSSRRDKSSSGSLDDFTRRYPKTGLSIIDELKRELSMLPKGSAEGHQKIDTLSQNLDAAITARLIKVEQKRMSNSPGMAKYEETTNTEVNGLVAKKKELARIREEFSSSNGSDNSRSGSFSTARERQSELSDDSLDSKKTRNGDTHPIVRLPPSEEVPHSPQTNNAARALVRGVGDWTGGRDSSASQLDMRNSSDGSSTSDSKDPAALNQVANQGGQSKGKGKAVEDPEQYFDHERNASAYANSDDDDSMQKKALNFDSPAFTPGGINNGTPRGNPPSLSSQAAAAAPFTPRGLGALTPNPPQHQLESDPMSSLNIAHIREFTPSFDGSSSVNQTGTNGTVVDPHLPYDAFQMSSVTHAMPSTSYNPFMEENNGIAADPMSTYYPAQNNYVAQPLLYHLYAPQGPHRDDLLPYQRQPHEFFIPETLRETFQRRAEATLQVMPNSQLPAVDPFHSLVALDTNQHQNTQLFGYPTWIYKALSQKNGKYYCLRRLEGYRPTNDRAIRSVKDWRRIDGTHVVKIHDAFTTRAFGDSSLVIVTDYHPLSRTLSELHLASRSRTGLKVDEAILWSYIVQISLALKEIHRLNLAARCIDPSKVILTDKNRIRLNGCAVLDVIQFDAARPLVELQQEDFQQFGRLIISIATHTPVSQIAPLPNLDQLLRDYSPDLVQIISWLIQPAQSPQEFKTIPDLLKSISLQTADVLSKLYSGTDIYTREFSKELENSRIARLLLKLNTINERPEYAHNPAWAETGDRYLLSLMRDFIFHQVDENGRPNLDLGWMLGCLNKLDAGSEERVELVSRDGQSSFVVGWRELKGLVGKSFGELMGGGGGGGGGGRGKR